MTGPAQPAQVETIGTRGPAEAARSTRGAAADRAAAPAPDASSLQNLSLADAAATLGSGRNLVADYVVGADSRLAEIRLIDPATHQVVAASPPDTLAQIQQEMRTYQSLAGRARPVDTSAPNLS